MWLSYFQTESSDDNSDAESSNCLEDDDLEPFDADDIVPEQQPVQVIEKPDRHPLCKDFSCADLEPFLKYISYLYHLDSSANKARLIAACTWRQMFWLVTIMIKIK